MYYDVNRSERTVTAKIENCSCELYDWLVKQFAQIGLCSEEFLCSLSELVNEKMLISNTYVGKAVCVKEDDFNVETGKILAARRAQEKYEKARTKVLERLTTDVIRKLIDVNKKQNERYNFAHGKVLEAEQLVRIVGKV